MTDSSQTTADLVARLRAIDEDAMYEMPATTKATVEEAAAEIERLRGAWLRVIQSENSCAVIGAPCNAKRCGCAAEQEMLIQEARHAEFGNPSATR